MAKAKRTSRRVFFLAGPNKPKASLVLRKLVTFSKTRCDVVGHEVGLDASRAAREAVDRIVVLGGDGTLIGVARSLGDRQRPLIGVNVGKLGYLAEFSLDEFERCFDQAIGDDRLIGIRTLLSVSVSRKGKTRHESVSVNDCVIQAGPPFRMVRLGLSIDGERLTEMAGDGIIVCTPTGSTAHNLSAGGPIMQPDVDAIVVTPLCAHSLTHKPLVLGSRAVIQISAEEVNDGTTAIIDGQVSCPMHDGDVVTVRRFPEALRLVRNPLYPPWHNLMTKLRWGLSPNYE